MQVTNRTRQMCSCTVMEKSNDVTARQLMADYRRDAIPASAIARAIAYAIEQPAQIDVNELVIWPTAQLA
ncbi:hypothetical protein [Marinicrinis lubricantis]